MLKFIGEIVYAVGIGLVNSTIAYCSGAPSWAAVITGLITATIVTWRCKHA